MIPFIIPLGSLRPGSKENDRILDPYSKEDLKPDLDPFLRLFEKDPILFSENDRILDPYPKEDLKPDIDPFLGLFEKDPILFQIFIMLLRKILSIIFKESLLDTKLCWRKSSFNEGYLLTIPNADFFKGPE